MSETSSGPPSSSPPGPARRIAPQLGPHVWRGGELSPADWMLALGTDHAAEIQAALVQADPGMPALPRLSPLLHEIAGRCDHGHGFVVLRGLSSADAEQAARILALLAAPLGRLSPPPGPAPAAPPPCDILALIATGTAELVLVSAGAAHNALLLQDRAALDALYRPPEGAAPVFAMANGVFAGRFDPAAETGPAALAAICADPDLALRGTLRAGELLFLNPFLVWPRGLPASLLAAGVITEASRAIGPFAPPLPDPQDPPPELPPGVGG